MAFPDLEPRFLPPANWHNGDFENNGRHLTFGYTLPQTPPKSAIVILTGRSEFREKYFEVMHERLFQDQAVFVMDWYGQGHSDHCPGENPQKDWCASYESHVSDLQSFITGQVKPRLPTACPTFMLAHSMGGNIGLRYLLQHPNNFSGAMFCGPMYGIKPVRWIPLNILFKIASLLKPDWYVIGGRDWHKGQRKSDGTDIFSSDPVRDSVHRAWCEADPALRQGDVTFGWIKNAVAACLYISQSEDLESLTLPCIFAIAGKEALVDNQAIRRTARRLPNAETIEFPTAKHEIMMETDDIRNRFFQSFDNLINRVTIQP